MVWSDLTESYCAWLVDRDLNSFDEGGAVNTSEKYNKHHNPNISFYDDKHAQFPSYIKGMILTDITLRFSDHLQFTFNT